MIRYIREVSSKTSLAEVLSVRNSTFYIYILIFRQEMIFIELTGKVLKNRYCILETLGKGGNATVYLARDMELGVLRAVKELPVSGKREARFLASLEHPTIPQMMDYEENSQHCYIVMEYIKGETLGELYRKERAFSSKELVDLGITLSQALGYLHSRKPPVFYGDLKPDNLMLSENGKLYLIDLGSAVAGYEKICQSCTGTRGFAAPEQYEGRIGPASDVFALGKTLGVLWKRNGFARFLAAPELAWILFRCCLPKEKLRYQNMEILEKRLGHLKKRGAPGGILVAGAGLLLVLFLGVTLFLGGFFLKEKEREPDFYDGLTEATEIYHLGSSGNFSPEEKEKVCREAEEVLLELLKKYRGQREYRRIMEQLALNREYAGDEAGAALYYEKLLQYDGSYKKVYGDYGMFLLSKGQREGCEKLWTDYQKKEREGGLEQGEFYHLTLWETAMKEREEKNRKRKEEKNETRKMDQQ